MTTKRILEELEKEKNLQEANAMIDLKIKPGSLEDSVSLNDCAELMVEFSERWIQVDEEPGTSKWEEKYWSRWMSQPQQQFLAIVDGQYHIAAIVIDKRSNEDLIRDVNTQEELSSYEITAWKKLS